MEYAIIESGSLQYRVQVGDIITTELLPYNEAKNIVFDKVLFYRHGDEIAIGKPNLDMQVNGMFEEVIKSPKKVGIRFEHKVYRRPLSHRQSQMKVKITEIVNKKES